jgi:uncharacterized protein YuzE
MKLTVDREADALYLSLEETPSVETETVSPGILLDYGANGQVVGIEMLHLSKRSPDAKTNRLLFETVSGLSEVRS